MGQEDLKGEAGFVLAEWRGWGFRVERVMDQPEHGWGGTGRLKGTRLVLLGEGISLNSCGDLGPNTGCQAGKFGLSFYKQ